MEGALASVIGGLTRGAGRRRAHQRRLRRRPRRASPRCSPCSRRARPASPSSASTTASARPAPSPGICDQRADPRHDHASPGSTASPASPATWRSARCSTPAPTVDRGRRPRRGASPVAGWRLTVEAGAARRHRARHAPSCRDGARPPPPPPTRDVLKLLVAGRRCPTACTSRRPGRLRARSPRRKARIHGVDPDDVQFHEVGALDAIVDVVGTCAALELLDVDDVRASPGGRSGTGTVAQRPRPAAQPGAGGRGPARRRRRARLRASTSPLELTTPDRRGAARRAGDRLRAAPRR